MSSLRSCIVLHLIEDLEALHALQAHSEHCSVQVEFKSTADPSKSVVLSSGSCSFTGSNLMTKDSKENSPNVVSASATKYTLELFALGGAESIGGHWLIRLRVAGGCYQHSLGVENRGLVGWCLVVPCLNCSGLMWLGRCQLIRNFLGGQWRQFSSLWLLA